MAEEQEGNVVFLNMQQGDMVKIASSVLEATHNDEIQCLFFTAIDNNGVLKMGRAGGFKNIQDFLLLLGGFDVQKDYVMTKMALLEEDDFESEEYEGEEYDEE